MMSTLEAPPPLLLAGGVGGPGGPGGLGLASDPMNRLYAWLVEAVDICEAGTGAVAAGSTGCSRSYAAGTPICRSKPLRTNNDKKGTEKVGACLERRTGRAGGLTVAAAGRVQLQRTYSGPTCCWVLQFGGLISSTGWKQAQQELHWLSCHASASRAGVRELALRIVGLGYSQSPFLLTLAAYQSRALGCLLRSPCKSKTSCPLASPPTLAPADEFFPQRWLRCPKMHVQRRELRSRRC